MNAYLLGFLATLLMVSARLACGQSASNTPPLISIIWPRSGNIFSDEILKIKAEADDPDGTVAEVEFFLDAELIGIATEPPFNTLLYLAGRAPGPGYLRAVVYDNLGAHRESLAVKIYIAAGRPAIAVAEINSPRNGAVLAAPANFEFRAEVLASLGEAGPVEFCIGTHSVAFVDAGARLTATTPPSSTTISNLPQGEYRLSVGFHGLNGFECNSGGTMHIIRVTNLGINFTRLTPDGDVEFEVVTSFPNVETIIEASPNLRDWLPISTNTPAENAFLFTDPNPPTPRRFYRVVVNSE